MYFFLPFKGLREAKSRWPDLGSKRSELILSILRHNLETVSRVVPSRHCFLVTADREVARIFPEYPTLLVSGEGLNQDLEAARELLRKDYSAGPLVVLLPDLPNLGVQDIEQLVAEARRHDVVICPDEDGVGTNALSQKMWDSVRFRFEGASFERHREEVDSMGLRAFILKTAGLAQDCDDVRDLERLCL